MLKQFYANDIQIGKWFEIRSLSRLCGLIVQVRAVPRRTVVGRRFDNLSESYHQSHIQIHQITIRALNIHSEQQQKSHL